MRKHILGHLVKMANFLDSQGRKEQADKIDSMMVSLASADDGALREWAEKAAQMAEQQATGGEDKPQSTAWNWLAEGLRKSLE